MSNRTIVELNHDYCPSDGNLVAWAQHMQTYMHSGDPKMLPQGVTFIDMRHHSEPSPIDRLTAENQKLRDSAKKLRRLLIGIKSFCFNHRARTGRAPSPGPYCFSEDVSEKDSALSLANVLLDIEHKIREWCDRTEDLEDEPAWKK